ncbi:mid region of cactin-domain-containing protein [Coniella lustricola]|uniref:Splicing factor Cactin n=1 Tax=Coniella lustricola TaxID=2025994 RepID=A0A2T3AGC2_9PEZI|nr:mid region of cactin-domain-containing protein [Coniella lustricola]
MNPARQAMIDGWKSPPRQKNRDLTAPRRDANTRVTKLPRQEPSKTAGKAAKYLSQDEQERKFVADEDKFVLKQSKKKADIRVREGRARPIDYLAFSLRYVDSERDILDDDEDDVEIDVPSPEKLVEGLGEADLKELESDIESFNTLETSTRNLDYWRSLLVLCGDRRRKISGLDHEGRAVSTVSSEIDKILGPKTLTQLETLEKQITTKLQSDEQIDTDYWEQLLKSLLVFKAKAKLKTICDAIRENRLVQLKKRYPAAEGEELEDLDDTPAGASASTSAMTTRTSQAPVRAAAKSSELDQPPPGTARFATSGPEDFSQATRALYEREVARGISENEEIFTAEETAPNAPKPLWANKYRPRKPQYFNRVQMGYEWNKYNQTHYDHDNPPPKVVQGYKFNIFYPDLIDKTKAPTFKIVREGGRRRGESFAAAGEEDTCLIRFIAGPPYEDIAFRIVDREWDYSAKRERGFRSSFDKGILQLHFQFKKIYYRK